MQLGYGTVYTARAARSRVPPFSLLVSFLSFIILTAELTFPFPPSLLLLTLMLFTLLHYSGYWMLVFKYMETLVFIYVIIQLKSTKQKSIKNQDNDSLFYPFKKLKQ